jgi:Amt family ammonium transporter
MLAGVLCALAVGLKYKFGYDDSLDVVGVHLVGGLVGTIGIGFLATADAYYYGTDGLFFGGDIEVLVNQVIGAVAVLTYSFVVTYIIGFALDKTIGFRIPEEDEVSGIDLVEHAESGYDLTPASGGTFRPSVSTSSQEVKA